MEYPVLNLIETGKKIKELREARNISIEELCIFLGDISLQAVYKWQAGKSLPTVDNLYAIARYFHVTIEDILVISNDNEKDEPER